MYTLRNYDDSPEPYDPESVSEAREHLRLIRDAMERSTRHSSLSGLAGLLIGVWAIGGVALTHAFVSTVRFVPSDAHAILGLHAIRLLEIWAGVLAMSALTDAMFNKRRAANVGKQVFSSLGARIVQAAAPSFFSCFVLTLFLLRLGHVEYMWGMWMLLYGAAICSVGLFSVRPVSVLGWSFVAAGALTLALPSVCGLTMMAVAFGGFHIVYGLWTGLTRGDW